MQEADIVLHNLLLSPESLVIVHQTTDAEIRMRPTSALKQYPTGNARDLGRPFDVVNAFQTLETTRKMALYDLLMFGTAANFRKTVEFLWPQANKSDAVRLESFVRRRLNAD